MGGAVELKSSLDVVLGKFSKCLTLAREILAMLRTQILPWLELIVENIVNNIFLV